MTHIDSTDTHEEGPQVLEHLRAETNPKEDAMSSTSIVQQATDGELFTTSEAIADGSGVEHRAVLQMIEKYAGKIEERFGTLAFEMRKSGGRPVRVAKLNEQQASFVLTLARNTDQVVNFKADLVAEFDRMAKQIAGQQQAITPEEQMAQGLLAAQQMLAQKDERIAELEPAADAWASVVSAKGTMSFRDAAKVLHEYGVTDIGGKRLIDTLLEWGWLFRPQTAEKDKTPPVRAKQTKVGQGVLEEKVSYYVDKWTGEKKISSAPQVRVTGKGLDAIRKRLMGGQLEVAA